MKQMRTGFTLVELLVVIAIIAILVLMMLPAINAMRESARRTQCMSKVSQLIMGIHSFEMSNSVYPTGVKNPTGPIVSKPQGFHHSWTIPLLPYIDESNVYRIIDPEKGVYDARNKVARDTFMGAFICPSAPVIYDGTGHSDYAAVHHDLEAPIGAKNHGVFFLNSRLNHDEVTDGLQYTFFVGEKITEDKDLGWMSGTRATLRNTGTPLNMTGPDAPGKPALSDEFLDEFDSPLSAPDFDISRDKETGTVAEDSADGAQPESQNQKQSDDPVADGPAPESSGPQQETAEDETVVAGKDPLADAKAKGLYVGGMGSHHQGGAVFAFGDGHVRFIDNAIDFAIYQRMGNRSDGQIVDGRLFDR